MSKLVQTARNGMNYEFLGGIKRHAWDREIFSYFGGIFKCKILPRKSAIEYKISTAKQLAHSSRIRNNNKIMSIK